MINSNHVSEYDATLDALLLSAIDEGRRRSLSTTAHDLALYDVLAYHLGFVDEQFVPTRSDVGKRIRPRLCSLSYEAAGGTESIATHAAAAIELLHNFTLLHDDIQDQSPLRRHRRTAWSIWGVPQAINAGDAMFAIAHLALNRLVAAGVDSTIVLQLSTELHQATLRIVEGQVLDLGFEQRDDVSADEYLRMISGKTAAICRYACWAGAILAGAAPSTAEALGDAGFALGVGFQLRDDLLGVWGDTGATGKAEADDIRRRKKALPAILLMERCGPDDRERVITLFQSANLTSEEVSEVLLLMTKWEIEELVQEEVHRWHQMAIDRLRQSSLDEPARAALLDLVQGLVVRAG